MDFFFAVMGSVIIYVVVDIVWYSNLIWGKIWPKLAGLSPKEVKNRVFPFIGMVIMATVLSFFFVGLVQRLEAYTWDGGFLIACWTWVGFIATIQVTPVLFAKMSIKLYLNNSNLRVFIYSPALNCTKYTPELTERPESSDPSQITNLVPASCCPLARFFICLPRAS